MLEVLAARKAETRNLMIDSTFHKVSRTVCSLALREERQGRKIGMTCGGWNSREHILVDACGRPIRMHLTGVNVSDYDGATVLLFDLPTCVEVLVANRGYDGNELRQDLKDKEIDPCIPSSRNRMVQEPYGNEL